MRSFILSEARTEGVSDGVRSLSVFCDWYHFIETKPGPRLTPGARGSWIRHGVRR
jgi:hypothetical protein